MDVEFFSKRRRHVLMLFLGVVCFDLLFAFFYSRARGLPWQALLGHWDSNWFVDLIENGRGVIRSTADEPRWAFLPLNLWVTKAVHSALSFLNLYVAGALVSFVSTCLALLWMTREASKTWTPQSMWGWGLWLLAPGSYVFFTFHTEGLFLLLSVLAIGAYFERKLGWVVLACFLAVITRNQGTLLGLSLAVAWFGWRTGAERWKALFIVFAVLCGQASLMTYAHFAAGDARAFFKAQAHWEHAQNWKQVLGTFVLYYEQAPLPRAWLIRALYAWGWLLTCVAMWRKRGEPVTWVYGFASFVPMLLQGVFHNAFRFSSVVFSLFFFLGDRLEKARPLTKGGGVDLVVLAAPLELDTVSERCLGVLSDTVWPSLFFD